MTILDTTKDLSALFRAQVRASPDAPALEDETTKYTYLELDAKVETLAQQLRQYGVGRDSLVGVLLNRSANYVIACLAALRAGGAFLVLEEAYPADLLADVLEDACPRVVVTHTASVGKIKTDACPIITLDNDTKDENGHVEELSPLPEDTDLDRLAFVAYSSGTTGKPKGIANPHRAAVLSYDLRFGVRDVQSGDRVACNVFFVWEIIRPLLRGATIVTIPDEASYDPVQLVDMLAAKQITETLMTPTLLAAVLSRHPHIGKRLPSLKTLWLNGEVVTTDLARRALKALPEARLLNVYSACETHEVACGDIGNMFEDNATYCPVGPLLDPKHTYVLNDSGQKVEQGESGELFVGGQLLARGYINRPETTARAFTPDPFDSSSGSRMYRTGDLARILPSGLLEITGRAGAMIKLRGYSVVPGKVQNAIVKHLAVKASAVVAHGEGLDRQLVAYFSPDKDATDRPSIEIDTSGYSPNARKILSPYLAQYMLPALWVEVEQLPTNEVSGKIDLKRLPPPPSQGPEVNGKKEERDPIGADDITEIWAMTLRIPTSSISPEHSFFDLGGHSLSLAELASRLSKRFGLRVPVARLADPPTLNGHLETVRAVRDGQIAAVQADLPAALKADSDLEESIKPAPGLKMTSLNDAETVLLTGVTGFLGAFLLNDLLESTSARIMCLVRCNDPSQDDIPAGIARIRRNMVDFGLWNDSIMERLEVLPANLSRKRFGLAQEEFDELASRVQVIVHAAGRFFQQPRSNLLTLV
jgi:amino acid adenylation domain-containing protein